MSEATTHESESQQIVERVRDWSLEERAALASEILACAPQTQTPKPTPLRNLVGLINSTGELPDDDAVRRMLDERRIRKFGA